MTEIPKTDDLINKAYKAGFEVGKGHSEPSPETKRMINEIKGNISEIREHLRENVERYKEVDRKIESKVPWIMFIAIVLILIGFAGYIVNDNRTIAEKLYAFQQQNNEYQKEQIKALLEIQLKIDRFISIKL